MLRGAIERIVANGATGFFLTNAQMWMNDESFRDFVMKSPAAETAGLLMGSKTVRIFKDQLFVKEPGSAVPTPWHHDITYWSVEGNDVCSIWLPLDDVAADNGAVEYVRGSHRWNRLFTPNRLGVYQETEYEQVPDFDNLRHQFDIVSFDVEPGDCIIFNAKTVHGAPANRSNRRRRAYSTRWVGDDATYCIRTTSSALTLPTTMVPGDPMEGPEFPVVWRNKT